jgi:hypothetical protein
MIREASTVLFKPSFEVAHQISTHTNAEEKSVDRGFVTEDQVSEITSLRKRSASDLKRTGMVSVDRFTGMNVWTIRHKRLDRALDGGIDVMPRLG